MSCEIKPIARIADIEKVQELFGFRNEPSWLNAVHFSFSPTKELLAFAHGGVLAFFSPRWSEKLHENVYHLSWSGNLDNQNEIITSLLCLPVISQGNSSQSSADWTCVAVGLSSGVVQFYMDFGFKLWEQQFFPRPVVALKAQSGKFLEEQLTVHYQNCLCIIQGTQLFPILRNLKKFNGTLPSDDTGQSYKIPSQKWMYDDDCNEINDSVLVGMQKSCAFDHLLNMCLENGFSAQYKAARTQHSLVMAVGAKPYVGFHFAKEGFNLSELTDAAKAVARYIKSALPSWLNKSQPQEVHSPPPPILSCQFGLCDAQRNAFQITLAPNKELAAVSDQLGRVLIVDCLRGIAVRMFKGYREAQCAFLEVRNDVKNDQKSGYRKTALFFVIFAPRREMLEIWPMQRGPRVAAFRVSKYGQLIYSFHSLMGVSSTSKPKYKSNVCLFLDDQDKTIKEIQIPFHFALSGSNSIIAKDLHLLKRLKMLIRSKDPDDEDEESEIENAVSEMVSDIQSSEFQQQCLEMMIGAKKITPLILDITLNSLNYQQNELHPKFKNLSVNLKKLVNFYKFITSFTNSSFETPTKIQISDMELLNIQKLVDLATLNDHQASVSPKVTFNDTCVKKNSFYTFLSIFNVDSESVSLKSNNKKDFFSVVGQTIYQPFLDIGHPLTDFSENGSESGIKSDDLMKLFLHYWLSKKFCYSKFEELVLDLSHFVAILNEICAIANGSVDFEYNSICPWWQNVREMLLENENSMRALLAALMCRNVGLKKSGDSDLEDEFENVSQEACQWTLLIGKLDDISVLGSILNNQLMAESPTFPQIKSDIPKISLKLILDGGKGIISELVAKWLASTGINPKLILEKESEEGTSDNIQNVYKNYQLTQDELSKETKIDVSKMIDPKLEPVLHSLEIMRKNFPFSLQSSVVLTNMAWEFLCYWSKNIPELEYLNAGIKCLEYIKEKPIQHGLCALIWKAQIKIPLEAAKKLIFKAGKLPKEKLCLQDVGLSDSVIPEFLEHVICFLNLYKNSWTKEVVNLKFEDILKQGPEPLTAMATKQKCANVQLIDLHLELADILHLVAFFNFKCQKQLSGLFDGGCSQLFFSELSDELKESIISTEYIKRYRLEFLNNVTTKNMESIRDDLEEIYLDDYLLWMKKVNRLADVWKLDKMRMALYQIVELYSFGWDVIGKEKLDDFSKMYPSNLPELGEHLLKIAGFRLLSFPKVTSFHKQATYGTHLSSYFDDLFIRREWPQLHQNIDDINFDNLISLCSTLFNCLAKSQFHELRVAGELYDSCMTLREKKLIAD